MYPIPPPMKKITFGEVKVMGCFFIMIFLIGLGLITYLVLTGEEIPIESVASLIIVALITTIILIETRKSS